MPGPASSSGLCSALLGPPGLTRASPGDSPGPTLVLSCEEPQPAWLTEEKDSIETHSHPAERCCPEGERRRLLTGHLSGTPPEAHLRSCPPFHPSHSCSIRRISVAHST